MSSCWQEGSYFLHSGCTAANPFLGSPSRPTVFPRAGASRPSRNLLSWGCEKVLLLRLSSVGGGSMSQGTAGLPCCPLPTLTRSSHGNSSSEQVEEADLRLPTAIRPQWFLHITDYWPPFWNQASGFSRQVLAVEWGEGHIADMLQHPGFVSFHPHTCKPSECHRAFSPYYLQNNKENLLYRKLCNRKSCCKIHNSKSHFSPPCTISVQLALIWDSFPRKYVCGSKISRFLVNCQKAFSPFSFTTKGKTSKRIGQEAERQREK